MESPVYEYDLASEVREHNRKQKLLRAMFAVVAVPLWALSYVLVLTLVTIPVTFLGGGRQAILVISWVMMAILAVEGIRYGKQLFDAERFARSFFGGLSVSEGGLNFSRAMQHFHGVPNPFALGFMVSQVLLCAPRSLVNAWKAHRSIIGADGNALEEAQRLFDSLLSKRDWIPLEHHELDGEELLILRTLGVLWSRSEAGSDEIRISAALTNRLYTP